MDRVAGAGLSEGGTGVSGWRPLTPATLQSVGERTRIEQRCAPISPPTALRNSAVSLVLQILTHHWTIWLFNRTMLLAMNKSAQTTTSSLIAGRPPEQQGIDTPTTLPLTEVFNVTEVELRAIKDEKLEAIRHAIDKGDYDSDAILEKALGRMLERLE